MNSKIIKISDDQNEITHESGLVTEFRLTNKTCYNCVYLDRKGFCLCEDAPCDSGYRFDSYSGIFVKKIIHEKFVE